MSPRPVQRWRVELIREGTVVYQHLSSVEQVIEHFAFLRSQTVETLYVAFLDTRNRIIGEQEVARGTLNQITVHPRDIFQAAILANCTSILLAHNHPSGDCTPSKEDRALTQQVAQAGELLGIQVLDHVIIGDPESYSFLEAGELKQARRRKAAD
jgi:DNA repair protein RadC